MATITEIPQGILHGFILPDDKVFGLGEKLKTEKHIIVQNSDGVNYKFFKEEDDTMWAVNVDDESIKHKIIKESDRESINEKHQSFKNYLKKRIRDDFPKMTEEQLELDADVLSEANESIKKLILQGVPSETAKEIILTVLQTPPELQTPDKLAELISKLSESKTDNDATETE